MSYPHGIEPSRWLEDAEKRQKSMLEPLEALVSMESPSEDKVAVDRASRVVAGWFEGLGGKIRWHRQKKFGDLLEVRFGAMRGRAKAGAGERRKPILLLGHLDTVWPMGTLEKMQFRISKGKAFGPGVYDMKAGVVMALQAVAMLRERQAQTRPVVVLLNSDEEVGSPVSRAVTEKIAKECEAVFVLEPAQGPQGAYKTARKGVGDYSVHVQGVAAHSGVDFEKGHSAVVELARLIERISQFTDLKTGLTVNPGTISGGTRTNVIAAEAQAEVDVRIARMRDAARVEKLFRGLRATDRGCTLTITGGMNRPPMERSRGTVALFQQSKGFAHAMGFSLEEASTGGGSDGNFTAALGIPTLDGMGAVGEGAHAPHESIVLSDLTKRTALLAAMIAG